jgi:hypothetical protein
MVGTHSCKLGTIEGYSATAIVITLIISEAAAALQRLCSSWTHQASGTRPFATCDQPHANCPLSNVSNVPYEFYDRLVFKQPVAGMITLEGTLDFLNAHLRHHFIQLERLRAQF